MELLLDSGASKRAFSKTLQGDVSGSHIMWVEHCVILQSLKGFRGFRV